MIDVRSGKMKTVSILMTALFLIGCNPTKENKLVTKTLKDARIPTYAIENLSGKSPYDVGDHLVKRGVKMPPGAKVLWYPEKKEIVITNTIEQINLVEQITFPEY